MYIFVSYSRVSYAFEAPYIDHVKMSTIFTIVENSGNKYIKYILNRQLFGIKWTVSFSKALFFSVPFKVSHSYQMIERGIMLFFPLLFSKS